MTDGMSGELKAMMVLETELGLLAEEERERVLHWAAAKFRVKPQISPKKPQSSGSAEFTDGDAESGGPDLATFFGEKAPGTDGDKALVVAYWLQVHGHHADIEAQRVNTELKHLGHAIGNITRAFETLKSTRPALVIQTRKEGNSKQARKKFKVTTEGRKYIEALGAAE